MEFKIGDKIKMICSEHAGKFGSIISEATDGNFRVLLEDNFSGLFNNKAFIKVSSNWEPKLLFIGDRVKINYKWRKESICNYEYGKITAYSCLPENYIIKTDAGEEVCFGGHILELVNRPSRNDNYKIGDKITVSLGGNVEPVEALITICNDQLKLVHENIKKNDSIEELKEKVSKYQKEVADYICRNSDLECKCKDLNNTIQIVVDKFNYYHAAYEKEFVEVCKLRRELQNKPKRWWF